MNLKKISVISVVILISAIMFSACSKVDSQPVKEVVKGAEFALKGMNGENIILSEILKDKKAVLVFFATWCPPCAKEVPHVNEYFDKNKDNVYVLGINVQESPEKVKQFMAKKNINYPVAIDSDGKIAWSYGVRGIPAVFAIDKDGSILYSGHDIIEMERKVNF